MLSTITDALRRGDASAALAAARAAVAAEPDNAQAQHLLGLSLHKNGDLDGARTALAELSAIATLMMTGALRAMASRAAGWIALAAGQPDDARRHLEDAVDRFVQSGAPFEIAAARIGLARALAVLGRDADAALEARRAVDLLVELKAEFQLAQARALLATLTD
ncbi:MAG TPA: tetratricopeptide repeat protein, partial [Luteimonas sp.]|nr:tetratricopeptide repeat protein [Luteimonas sp.]